ncbi:MAG: integrase [Rubrivivax sp.]|nr:integrase [Rubrivivax sp.]
MSRSRERTSAKGLLPLMEARPWKDGKTVTYRYHPIGGRPITLGTDLDAAIAEVLRLNRQAPDSGTFGELWRLYQRTPEWADLAEGTRMDYRLCWTQLEPRFGKMAPRALTAQHCRRYLRVERADAPVRANRELAVLSNLCNVAIDTGDADINVCRHVRRNKERPRHLAPEASTLERFLSWAWARGGSAAVLSGMAEFAARTGNRRVEFRELHWPQWSEIEARLFRAKRRAGAPPVVEVLENSAELLDLRQRMLAISGANKAGPVFPAARGGAYRERAFKSAWQRLMADATDATAGPPVLLRSERFTFHDLRAYFTTEHKRQLGRLPDLHANPATTARVYDRTKVVRRSGL